MQENFTSRANRVIQLAEGEARRSKHAELDTGHLLLGLIKEGSGVAANVLRNVDLDLRRARQLLEQIVLPGSDEFLREAQLLQTPRFKKAIEYAGEEAEKLKNNYIGTEHLLLGLLHDYESVACQILGMAGIDRQDLLDDTYALLGHAPDGRVRFCFYLNNEEMAALEKLRVLTGKTTTTETLEAYVRVRLAELQEPNSSG